MSCTSDIVGVVLKDDIYSSRVKQIMSDHQEVKFDTLKKYIVQLQYPVKKGISKSLGSLLGLCSYNDANRSFFSSGQENPVSNISKGSKIFFLKYSY